MLQVRTRDRKSDWPEGWTSSRVGNQNPLGLQVSKPSSPTGASAVLLIDYANNNPLQSSGVLLSGDDLLRTDHGFSSLDRRLASPKISALFSKAQSPPVVPAAHAHPPFPLALVGSFTEQVRRRRTETDAELGNI